MKPEILSLLAGNSERMGKRDRIEVLALNFSLLRIKENELDGSELRLFIPPACGFAAVPIGWAGCIHSSRLKNIISMSSAKPTPKNTASKTKTEAVKAKTEKSAKSDKDAAKISKPAQPVKAVKAVVPAKTVTATKPRPSTALAANTATKVWKPPLPLFAWLP